MKNLIGSRPILVLLRKQRVKESLQIPGVVLRDGILFLLNNLVDKTKQTVGPEGVLQCAELVEHTSKSPDIRFEAIGSIGADLRTHVVGGPHYSLSLLQSTLQYLRNAEVPQFDGVIARQKDIRSLNIPVEDAPIMDEVESEHHLQKPIENKVLLKFVALPLHLLDVVGQISGLAVLHHDNEVAVLNEGVDVVNNMGMVQVLEQSGLQKRVFLFLF